MSAIDAVYTWVDHRDAAWQRMYREATHGRNTVAGEHASADNPARFANRDELRYSVQSLRRHAPWIRTIHVVTNCALPSWAEAVPNIVVVAHEDVFPNPDDLPSFNSCAIETVLHCIDGLAENFLYFNDDFFLCRNVQIEDFFDADGCIHFFPSRHDVPYDKRPECWRPVDQGAINSARLLFDSFGKKPQKKLHHTPYVLKKSILEEIERRYPDEVKATRSHAFRHPDDIAMATTLHAYYAQYTGRGEARGIASRYVDIGDWRFLGLVHPWSPLMRGKYTTLCLNEVTAMRHFGGLRDRIVRRVMQRLFD